MMEGNPVDRNIYLALQIIGVIILLGRRPAVVGILRANAALVLYVLYCAFSVMWSDYSDVSFKHWIKMLGDVTMALIVVTTPDRSRALGRVLTAVGFILVPMSIMLIKYYPELARSYDHWTGKQFVTGVATDKNMLGMSCLVFGLGALWRFLTTYKEEKSRLRTRRLICYGILLASTFWLFHLADSMTSMSCFFMGAALMLVINLSKRARKPAIVHLMVAGIVGAAISVLFLHIGSGAALGALGRNPTLTGRTEIWAGLLNFVDNPLLGSGFDGFWLGKRLERIWAAGSFLQGINESHNGYFEVYLNLGWVGVALLAGLIVTGYRKATLALRQSIELASLKLVFFVIAIVYSFTEAGFRIMCSVWFAFLLSLLIPSTSAVRRSQLVTIPWGARGDTAESQSRYTGVSA